MEPDIAEVEDEIKKGQVTFEPSIPRGYPLPAADRAMALLMAT
jgi:hypothetical protein